VSKLKLQSSTLLLDSVKGQEASWILALTRVSDAKPRAKAMLAKATMLPQELIGHLWRNALAS
jgi:hypothetical protein